MGPRRRDPERGGSTIEYLAVGAVVLALVAGVVAVVPTVGTAWAGGLSTLMCRVTGQDCAAAPGPDADGDAADPLAGDDGQDQGPGDGGGDEPDGLADDDVQAPDPGDGGGDDDGGFLDDIGDWIGGVAASASNEVGEWIGKAVGGLGGLIGEVAGFLGGLIGDIGSLIGNIAAGIGRIIGEIGSLIGSVAATIGDIVSGIGDIFDGKEEVEGTPVPVPPEEFVKYALEHPERLVDYTTTPDEFLEQIGGVPKGWRVTTLGQGGHAGQGWKLEEVDANGNLTGRQIRWHPGGGRHGPDPYWTFTSGEHGKKQIYNPDTFVP